MPPGDHYEFAYEESDMLVGETLTEWRRGRSVPRTSLWARLRAFSWHKQEVGDE